MRAITFNHPGSPDVLQMSDRADCQPGAEDVLVKVRACGVNRADCLQRRGVYPPPKGESDILGLELAGDVVACGDEVTRFAPGQRVFGLVGSGAYAEYCCLHQDMAIATPNSVSDIEAAATAEAFFTAHETLFELGQLTQGESVLIHAGGSGVGSTGIQMAKLRGAKVFTTAGSHAKVKKLLDLGADVAIDYKTQNFLDVIRQETDQTGVQLIQDFVGPDYFLKNLHCLSQTGRLVQVAMMTGRSCELDLSLLLRKRLTIKGFIMRAQSLPEKVAIKQRFEQHWLPCLANKQLAPIIDRTFPIEEVRSAHAYMEANRNFGKIVLTFT